jgi:agmatine deiminase
MAAQTAQFTPGSPAAAGYRMPGEWEPHEATWLSWPKREGISFPGLYDDVLPTFIEIVAALQGSENVRINVTDSSEEAQVRAVLAKVDTSHVEFFHIPTNEPWCRDHGPIFVRRGLDPKLAVIDWGYNAWGAKYPPFDLDDVVPTKIAERLGFPVYYPGLVMEGGSLDVNGDGALLTTTSCLLNANRNPGHSQSEIEQALRDYLGVSQVIWLGDGIEGDDTDGHIDDITRFVGRNTVLTAIEPDPKDANHRPLAANLEKLRQTKLHDGSALEVIEIPMPPRIERDGQRLPASYVNFYIGNKVILLPIFCSPLDEQAICILQDCFPGRWVIGIDCRNLVWGLGAFHCLTQQQPAI